MTSIEISSKMTKEIQAQIAANQKAIQADEKALQAAQQHITDLKGSVEAAKLEVARLERLLAVTQELSPEKLAKKASVKKAPALSAKPVKAHAASGSVNKSEFIRQNPDLKASELVEKAAQEGITLTSNFVYTIRAQAKKSGKTDPKAPKVKAPAPKAAVAKPATPRHQDGQVNKSEFIRQNPSLSVKDLIAKADAEEVTISKALIYMVRNPKGGAKAPKAPKAEAKAPQTKSDKQENPLSKIGFVRANPNLTPAQIEVAAKKAGLEVSANYASSIRSNDRKAGKKAPAAIKASPATKKAAPPVPSGERIGFPQMILNVLGTNQLSTKEILGRLEAYPEARESKNMKSYLGICLSRDKHLFARVGKGVYQVVPGAVAHPKDKVTVVKPTGAAPEAMTEEVIDATLAQAGIGTEEAQPTANPFQA